MVMHSPNNVNIIIKYNLHYAEHWHSLTYFNFKEKSNLEEDKDKLKSSLNKALVQNQHLAVELEAANSRSSDLKTHSHKLEASLEKVSRQ